MKRKIINVCKGHCIKWSFIVSMLLYSGVVFAQNHKVAGLVTDYLGEPLIGVTVVDKETKLGVVSDIDGQYSISVSPNSILVYTFIGMKPQEISVDGKTKIDVKLEEAGKELDEIIVIGYGTVRKADLTTSVASVSSKDFNERPIVSAEQALQGKAAGVQIVQPSGKPGAGISVRVRGTTSLNAGNDPLYVIDGIPTNDISSVSPSDIESLQILKDASSAAIYGSRGSNGVVLITTKKGSQGASKINVSMYAGFSEVSRHLKTLNTTQFYDLMEEIGQVVVDRTNTNYTDWAKEMYKKGVQQNYQVSLSGGTEKTNYYISTGYQEDKGIIAPAKFSRISLRSNIDSQVKDWLKVTTNISFAKTGRRETPDNLNVDRGGVVLAILNTPPFMGKWDKEHPNWYYRNPYQGSWENPYAAADDYDFNEDYRFMGNLGLDFTIIEGLHFKPSISVDYTDHNWDKFIHPERTVDGRTVNGSGEHADDNHLTWVNENILTYNTRIKEKHNLTVMGGATFQRYNHKNAYLSVQDFIKGSNLDPMPLNMANKINSARTGEESNSLVSFLGRVQYDYESKYLFTANFRTDGSSKLHPDSRWATFPSISAGWRFTSEKFFEPLTNVVNDAKLRLGWGRNGSQNGIGNYDYMEKTEISQSDQDGNGPNWKWGRYGNKDLTWEITTQFNAGLDLSLFNSRLTAEFDVYSKKTTGLLLYATLPESVSRDIPMRNDGEMMNKGFEFNVNGKILTGEFNWNAGLNMSFNKNELTKLSLTRFFMTGDIEAHGKVIRMQEGLSMGTFWGYIAQGVNPDTGDMIYKDLDNNGKINGNDMTNIGSAQPDCIYGFTNNFSWRNISLTVFFQGSQGNDIYNASRAEMEGMISPKNQSVTVLERWVRPGMITSIPRAGNADNSLPSSRFVEDGSYLRLKTLTLSYNFDKKITNYLGMSNLSVYATANNLLTLTKYKGYDPELSWIDGGQSAQIGIDRGTYPQTRSFIFGLNLTF